MGNKAFVLLIAGIVVIAGFWLWREFTKPLPGQMMADMGREHITDISDVAYNTNPPTSGSHFAIWTKEGVYDRAISDGYLLHSLEHGYIVISYNCQSIRAGEQESISFPAYTLKLFYSSTLTYAHETGEPHEEPNATESGEATNSDKPLTRMNFTPPAGRGWFTPQNPPEKEVELPESFNSQECKDLVSKLSEMTKVAEKVIVVPRPANDSLIALTAWGRIEKLDNFDKEKIEGFIKSWHNRGPEKTVE